MNKAINTREPADQQLEQETGPVTAVYPSLETEARLAVDTACAAWHLNRRPQTMRSWASTEAGPIRPLRVHGRLAWPVSELRRVLGVSA